jgi:hypothetical protein
MAGFTTTMFIPDIVFRFVKVGLEAHNAHAVISFSRGAAGPLAVIPQKHSQGFVVCKHSITGVIDMPSCDQVRGFWLGPWMDAEAADRQAFLAEGMRYVAAGTIQLEPSAEPPNIRRL